MSEILLETTEWNCSYFVPNHTYLLDKKGCILAYINSITNELIISNNPIKLDKRYRKFKKTSHPQLEKILKKQKPEKEVDRSFEVKSKENVYIVDLIGKNYKCNCIGYSFRGYCKHIEAVKSKIEK